MSYIAAVKTHINSSFLDNGNVLVGEADCKDITIKGKHVILKTDHKDFKEKIIDTLYNAGNARCICDYVVISDSVVLVCELKSNNSGKMSIQLRNTGRMVRNILEMIQHHGKIPGKIPPIKYVCFKSKGNKQTTLYPSKLIGQQWLDDSVLYQLSCNTTYHLKQFN